MTSQDPTTQLVQVPARTGESRWPMALAVLVAGGLRAALPPQLRNGDTRWAFIAVVVVLLAILVIGDPGRIDRESHWLRVLTGSLIGLITAVNASAAVRLVAGIIGAARFSTDANVLLASGGAIWLTNVIAFGLWYWDLDRGGAAAPARGAGRAPALLFPGVCRPGVRGAGRPSCLHLPGDVQPGVRRAGLGAHVPRLPAPLVLRRDGLQPHGRL